MKPAESNGNRARHWWRPTSRPVADQLPRREDCFSEAAANTVATRVTNGHGPFVQG
jgi:hypothetical protein